jgi:hypothetical protein
MKKFFQRLLVLLHAGVCLLLANNGSAQSLGPPGSPSDVGYDERTAATLSVENPGILLGRDTAVIGRESLQEEPKTQGLQFKDPIISSRFTYRQDHDSSSPGGFDDDEYSGELSLDADIYDGLLAGLLYQHADRAGHNSVGTNEQMYSDGFSLYLAKRFLELVNAGAAYNFVNVDHQLTGTTAVDLDRVSNGFTVFAGVSDKIGEWYLAGTASFVYVHDDYDAQNNLDTGMFTFAAEASYDVTEVVTAGVGASYNRYVIQDTLAGSPLDSDYFAVGPRFAFFPTDDVTVRLDLETWQGYVNYDAYKVSVAVDYAF